MNKDQKKSSEHQISRREALRMMTFGSIGLAMGGSVLQSCAPKNSSAGASAIKMSAPDGTRIVTRKWEALGEEVGLLGLGCMRLPQLPKGQGRPGQLDQDKVNEMVDYALEHGINYFDTAPAYGDSERAVGEALQRHERSSYLLATKMSNFNRGHLPSFEEAKAMFEKSLANLHTDYFDFYLLHCLESAKDFIVRFTENGLLDWLFEQKAAGRIHHLGFSFHGSNSDFDELLNSKYKWDFVQIQMNYIDWKHGALHEEPNSEYLYNELYKRSIPVVIMEPLLGGQLATLNDKASRQLRAITPNSSIASWAFRFCGTHPGVMTVLSGMTYLEHVKDNVKTFSPLVPLTEDELNLLEDVAKIFVDFPLVPCTACNYCMPCPYGLDIPGVFAHYNKCINEGYVSEDEAGTKEYRKARRAFLVSLDRNVEKLRQANHCIGCHKCMEACPQKIDIPHTMRRIDSYTEKIRRNG